MVKVIENYVEKVKMEVIQNYVEKVKTEAKSTTTFLQLLRWCAPIDYALLFIGVVTSLIHGGGMPVLAIVFGQLTNEFLQLPQNATDEQRDAFERVVATQSVYFAIIGIVVAATSYLQIACFEAFGERIMHRIRCEFFRSVLHQDMTWFDKQSTGKITTRMQDDIERMREGFGDKLSLITQYITTFITGFIIGFTNLWQLTLVMVALTPVTAATASYIGRLMATYTRREQLMYGIAGQIADESLGAIRTIHSLNGQQFEINRYRDALEVCRASGAIKYFYVGLTFGVNALVEFGSYGLAFWYGAVMISNGTIASGDAGRIFTVFGSVMQASVALGACLPHFETLSTALGCGSDVFEVINARPSESQAQASSEDDKIPLLKGDIHFENVTFSYPQRPDVKILDNVSFHVPHGTSVAFVGSSGSGKSTIGSLLLRFYDPTSGKITIDGKQLSSIKGTHIRTQFGVVTQEPVLFDCTIKENVLLGRPTANDIDINVAMKQAYAADFVSLLHNGENTRVGDHGSQLSGGQKQRVAIARALVRHPPMLLLDEATSALDARSEQRVKLALDQASKSRTTIVIAHRLSTIANVDHVIVLEHGKIVEEGKYAELLKDTNGVFHKMIAAQQLNNFIDGAEGDTNAIEDDIGSDGLKRIASLRRSVRCVEKTSTKEDDIVETITEPKKEEKEEVIKVAPLSKLVTTNKDNLRTFAIGAFLIMASGAAMPAFALVYSQVLSVYMLSPDAVVKEAQFWAGMFVLIGVYQGSCYWLGCICLGRCGEQIVLNMRLRSFASLIRQDAAFFDRPENSSAQLCSRLAADAPRVRHMWTRSSALFQQFFCITVACTIAFICGWQMALLMFALLPFLVAAGYIEKSLSMNRHLADTKLMEHASKWAIEAISNIRTVQSLTSEDSFHKLYCDRVETVYKRSMRGLHSYAISFAFSQCVMYIMYSIGFRFGGYLISENYMTTTAVFRVFFSMAFCGVAFGQMMSMAPDVARGRIAATLMFRIIDSEPAIDNNMKNDERLKISLDQKVKCDGASFAYPTRPNHMILNNFSVNVEQGKTLALVGPSGCGKSTIVSLIERFYDPAVGKLTIGPHDIKDVNLSHTRSQLGLVSQEPRLFNCTIQENICYGLIGDDKPTQEQMEDAAKQANIHNFIITLPMGYDTSVGERGAQLSGGQKQRIAIARALIRKPRVLLLDEATSALDTESEKLVQEALDVARANRTCIMIAHRLSTVKNADQIVVVGDGTVVEAGTHDSLMSMRGAYYTLCQMQSLEADEKKDD